MKIKEAIVRLCKAQESGDVNKFVNERHRRIQAAINAAQGGFGTNTKHLAAVIAAVTELELTGEAVAPAPLWSVYSTSETNSGIIVGVTAGTSYGLTVPPLGTPLPNGYLAITASSYFRILTGSDRKSVLEAFIKHECTDENVADWVIGRLGGAYISQFMKGVLSVCDKS